jgi:hypothetical protein
MMLQLDSSLGGVIQGALVLATLGMHGWRRIRSAQAGGREASGRPYVTPFEKGG